MAKYRKKKQITHIMELTNFDRINRVKDRFDSVTDWINKAIEKMLDEVEKKVPAAVKNDDDFF